MVIVLSLLVAIVGALMYLLSSEKNAKFAEIGRIMFFCGLFAFLLEVRLPLAIMPGSR